VPQPRSAIIAVLLVVGDVDQLPSVGPGQVLADAGQFSDRRTSPATRRRTPVRRKQQRESGKKFGTGADADESGFGSAFEDKDVTWFEIVK